MKNFVPQTGGHPITLDDFTWLQSQFLEVTQELVGAMGSPDSGNRILSGGEVEVVSPTLRNVNGGWLFWNGELIRFNGASLTGTGHVVVSKATASVPPSKVYANSSVVFPYRETVGSLQTTPTAGNSAFFYIESAMRFGVSGWLTASLVSPDWKTYQPSPSKYHVPGYRVLVNGVVDLRGHLEIGSVSGLPIAFTLPEGYRPKRSVSISRTISTGAGLTNCWIEINPLGEVQILNITMTVGDHLSLDGISFDSMV